MDSQWAAWLVNLGGVYLGLGFLFAIAFVSFGLRRIDPAAEGAKIGFRLLILPGVTALWPLFVRRWITGSPPPNEINRHRERAR